MELQPPGGRRSSLCRSVKGAPAEHRNADGAGDVVDAAQALMRCHLHVDLAESVVLRGVSRPCRCLCHPGRDGVAADTRGPVLTGDVGGERRITPPFAAEGGGPRSPPITANVENVTLMIANPGPMWGSTSRAREGARSIKPRNNASVSSSLSCSRFGLPDAGVVDQEIDAWPPRETARSTMRRGACVRGSGPRRASRPAGDRRSPLPQPGQPALVAAGRADDGHAHLGEPRCAPVADAAAGSRDDCDLHLTHPVSPAVSPRGNRRARLRRAPWGGPDLMLEDLARVEFRQLSQMSTCSGALNFATPLLPEAAEARDVGRRLARRNDHRASCFTGARIGQADDRDFGDRGMAEHKSSISLGAIFSPLRIIRSLIRPVTTSGRCHVNTPGRRCGNTPSRRMRRLRLPDERSRRTSADLVRGFPPRPHARN